MSWNLRAARMSKVNIVISLESSVSMINPGTKTLALLSPSWQIDIDVQINLDAG